MTATESSLEAATTNETVASETAASAKSLIDCFECGHSISRKAEMCPKCGHSRKWKKWLIRGGIFTLGFLFIAYHEPIIRILHLPETVDMMLHHLLGIPMDHGHS